MVWYFEKTVFQFGRYKGKKVSDVDDAIYISIYHHSKLNVYFKQEVLDRLNIINNGKRENSNANSDR